MRLLRFTPFLGIILCLLGWVSLANASAQPAFIDQVLYFKENTKEDIYISLNRKVSYRVFALDNPTRLVLEVPLAQWRAGEVNEGREPMSIIKAVRFAQFDETHSRLVLDLKSKPIGMNHRFFIDGKTGKPIIQISLGLADFSEKDDSSESFGAMVDTSGIPIPRMKPRNADFALVGNASGKKVQKPVIVVDAGHGDQDPGAIGPGGTREKDVTLSYARALRDALENTGRYKVVLTRDGDHFIRLRDRIKIARDAKANLFVSLHADSAPTHNARGLSVYTVSEKASDEESAKLAERENSSDIIAGFPLADTSEDVANILIDLAQRETKTKSGKFASQLVYHLDKKVRLLENSHRYAGFAVLKAPDIPSVLVETGFLSNPKEERLLNSADYKKRIVQGIVNGIDSYFEKTTKAL